MSVDTRPGDIVSAFPNGSDCRAVTEVQRVTDAGGGDLIIYGDWFFEDGRRESLEVYAGMCFKSDQDELKEVEMAYQNCNKF